MPNETIQTKYRPSKLEDVVGHESVKKALRKNIDSRDTHAFLFTGPSGVGKTTLSRIVATEVGCQPEDLMEVDAATFTGIDDMRAVTESLSYRPLGAGAVKAIIIDEAHGLSKQAWNSLLKNLEEPQDWVYWFLCTTEASKVPVTVRTRCAAYELKLLPAKTLGKLYDHIADAEQLETPGDVGDLIIEKAEGSARQLLSNIAVASAAKNLKEASELLRSVAEDATAIDLARALNQRAKWFDVVDILRKLEDANPEGVRHVVQAYMSKVVLGAKRMDDAGRALEVLDAFSEPFNSSDGKAPLILACGRLLLR